MGDSNIVIFGGGQSAANAVKAIRVLDAESPIILVSDESSLPYERPPLSKTCITGGKTFQSCVFFDKEFYEDRDVDLRLGCRVEIVDFNNHRLLLDNQLSIPFDRLLIATGGKNRTISIDGLDDEDILQLRTREESQKIIAASKSSHRTLVIGGGFIGLEVAASLRTLGKEVTLIESGAQLMGRAMPKEISDIVQEKHMQMGVDIRLDTTVTSATTKASIYEVTMTDGSKLVCDLIIAGIGIEPNLDALELGSIHMDNGLVTDQYGKTSIENVYAAGDVSSFWHPLYNTYIRLESFKHAQGHGINAGKNIAGDRSTYEEIPWMWSDQYDLNIQSSGLTNTYDTCVIRGSSLDDGICWFYLQDKKIKAVCGVSVGPKIGRDIRIGGMLSAKAVEVDPRVLEDTGIKLQTLMQ